MMRLGLIPRPVALPRLGAVLATLPDPPQACNWHALIPLDGDALGNDLHANCVECGALRALQIQRAAVAGDQRKPTADEALALYGLWSGFPAQDNGTRSDVAADRWGHDGIAWGAQYEDVPALAAIDATNVRHVMQAIATLGPIQLDLALPLAWEAAKVWDVNTTPEGQPGSWGAHRVCAGRYDATSLYVVTWGEERAITWAAVGAYRIDAWATATRSWVDVGGKSPAGLSYDALVAQLAEIAT